MLLGLSIVSPILPYYANSFNVNYTLVGLIISAFGIARMLIDLPTSQLAAKYNKKKLMLIGLFLIIISSIMAGLAPSYWILLIARIIEGFGSAIYVTTATIYLALIASPERRGFLMSVYSGFLLLGSVFGPSFGGFIASLYGYSAPFFAYTIIVAVGIIPTLILPYIENLEDKKEIKLHNLYHNAWKSIKDPVYLPILLSIFTLFFIRTGVSNTLVPLFSGNNLGLDEFEIGIILSMVAIATAIAILPIGIISDKIGRRIPMQLSLFILAIITFWIPFATNIIYLLLLMLIYGAFFGTSGLIAAYVTDIAPPNKLEIYMGVYRTIGDIGFVSGPLLTGFIVDITSIPSMKGGTLTNFIEWVPFGIVAIIMLISCLILFKAPKK